MCAGGSLSDVIVKKEMQGKLFSEAELKDLLLQVSMGLKYIHGLGLVHLDIKPSILNFIAIYFFYLLSSFQSLFVLFQFFAGNIFICQRTTTSAAGVGESDDEEEDGSTAAGVVYKIGIKCGISWLHCWSVVESHFIVVCRGSGSCDLNQQSSSRGR